MWSARIIQIGLIPPKSDSRYTHYMKTLPSIFLSPSLLACFTTRYGGVSKYPFNTNNLAFHVGDDFADVVHNHELTAKILNYEHSHLVYMRQIHSDRIIIVNESMDFDHPPEGDALITNRPNIPLMVMGADCTPVLIHDPISGVIGCVHAGRAGALKEILPKTIHTMCKEYGARIDNLQVSLGPSIHGCCYEINETIANEVFSKKLEDALRREGEKVYLDVNTILHLQLNALGIKKENIEVINECTSCNSATYFSYRANAGKTGRIAGIIMLRETCS
jgi:hypothetical protein